jgi:hypothetical protein
MKDRFEMKNMFEMKDRLVLRCFGVRPLSRAGVLAAVALAAMPVMVRAQVPSVFQPVDDFTKDKVLVAGTSGTPRTVTNKYVAIDQWARAITLTLGASTNNPYTQPVQVQVVTDPGNSTPPALVWSVGYGNVDRIDLDYGPDGPSAPSSINLNAYDRIRVVFGGLTSDLNFSLTATQSSNNQGTVCGANLLPTANQFTVDFPFSQYRLNGSEMNFSEINALDFIFQGGSNLAVTGIYAVPAGFDYTGAPNTPSGPATYTCSSSS